MSQTIFVNFTTENFQGVFALSSYALPQCPFTFTPILSSNETKISTKKVLWNFGDGTTSTDIMPVHYYSWPGVYNISLVIYNVNGDAYISSFSPSVSVIDFLSNQLSIDTKSTIALDIPAGQITPFQINRSNSWQTFANLSGSGYTANLYVSGSLDPLVDIAKYNTFGWSHLLQQCYFYKKQIAGNTFEYVPVSNILTSTDKIYASIDENNQINICPSTQPGSFFVGTTGTVDAYFTSNKPKNYSSIEAPLIIFASLDTAGLDDSYTDKINYFDYNTQSIGYLNTKPAVLYAYSRYNPATTISFSTNGIDTQGDAVLSTFQIPQISWQNTVIPFVIKLEDGLGFSTLFYPLLSSNVTNQSTTASAYNITISLLSGSPSGPNINVPFYTEFLNALPSNVGGYFKGYFISPSALNTAFLSAAVIVQDPEFYKLNTVNSIYSNVSGTVLFADQDIISSEGNTSSRIFQLTPKTISPLIGNTFAVAPSSPIGYKQNLIWALSSDNVFTLDYTGNTINQFSIFSTVNNIVTSVGPASIALDGVNNAWISLFTASSAIKINSDGTLLSQAYAPNLPTNTNYPVNAETSALVASLNLIAPLYVETDHQNNVWVSYVNPQYNYIVKYNSTGTYSCSTQLASYIIPDKIIVDRNNNPWVIGINVNYSNVFLEPFVTFAGDSMVMFAGNQLYSLSSTDGIAPSAADVVCKLSTTGTVLQTISGFTNPTSIIYDINSNIWVSHNINTLTRIDANTYNKTNYIVGSAFPDNLTQSLFALNCNTYNKLTVYNLADNSLYIIDAAQPVLSSQCLFGANYITDTGDDFNGYRWISKYASVSATVRSISGISNAFSIYPDTGVYNITKQNENFDMAAYLATLKLPEYLVNQNVLFKDFLGSIFGSVSSEPYELGKTLYERIGNFGDNTSNVDTATVEALISLSEQTGTGLSNVIYEYPPQLRRIIDILSIKHSKLYGSVNQYNSEFSSEVGLTPSNLGSPININTGVFSLSETLVVYEKFSNQYKKVKMPALSTYSANQQFSLALYTSAWGLPLVLLPSITGTDVGFYYNFYRYNSTIAGNPIDSVINWDDPLGTLFQTNSSYSDWAAQDGIMDNALNYEMSKGLRLFTSAVDIVYNN